MRRNVIFFSGHQLGPDEHVLRRFFLSLKEMCRRRKAQLFCTLAAEFRHENDKNAAPTV
jgi:hypothetical protein